MVRLKDYKGDISPDIVPSNAFQFHNGSIKRKIMAYKAKTHQGFQFHNGSIKSRKRIKDRKEDAKFQFHNGSIKSGLPKRR